MDNEESTQEEYWLDKENPDMIIRCNICSEVMGTIIVSYDDMELCCKECAMIGFFEALQHG